MSHSLKVCASALAVSLSTAVVSAEMPHWIDILPLSEKATDSQVSDAVFLGNRTISDGIAWSCTLVPEGDPVMDKAAVYVRRCRAIAPRVKARSKIRQGFLLQATIGHGWTPSQVTPWQKLVRADGTSPYRFCPLGEDFRAYVAGQVRTLAAVKPDFFMVDDDVRLLGRRIDGCFCPLHLAGFSAKTGRDWTRTDLVARIEAGDADILAAWNAYTDATFLDYLRMIRAAVPSEIPVSLCAVAGFDRWLKLAGEGAFVLAGSGVRPVLRIGSAPYWGDGLYDILDVRRSVARQLAAIGPAVDVIAEADTCPQLRWQTSATRALDHMTVLTAEGCRGAKMWWHRMSNPLERQSSAAYLQELGARSGQLRWLANADFRADGVWCPADCEQPEWGASVFGRLGMPYRYGTRRPGDVVALTGASLAHLDAVSLTNVLAGPVLLDGSAAIALTRRGFGDLIGVRAKPWNGRSISFEELGGVRLFGSTGSAPADLSGCVSGAREMSRLYNRASPLSETAAYLAPGSIWFENRLGGRILALAASVPNAPLSHRDFGYCNETRKIWLIGMLTRLGGGLPGGVAYAGDVSLLCEAGRTAHGERIIILDNLDLDDIENPELVLAQTWAVVERLADDGSWVRLEVERLPNGHHALKTQLRTHRPAIFRFTTNKGDNP